MKRNLSILVVFVLMTLIIVNFGINHKNENKDERVHSADSTMLVGNEETDITYGTNFDMSYKGNEIYYIDENLPDEIRQIVISNREKSISAALAPDRDLFETFLTTNYNKAEDDAVVEILQNTIQEDIEVLEISREDAIKDVTFLVNYLKYFYGGYGYFGGDTVFFDLRDEIINELSYMEEPILVIRYKQILLNNLKSVINDKHFHIGSTRIIAENIHASFLVNEEYFFIEKENAFVSSDNRYKFISAYYGECQIDLIPYINNMGEFVWALGYLNKNDSSINITLNVENTATKKIENIEIRLIAPKKFIPGGSKIFYNVSQKEGVTIATSRRLSLNASENDEGKSTYMLKAGEQLQNESVIIIDLRNNGGGNSTYAALWIQGLLQLESQPGLDMELRNGRYTKTVAYVSPHTDFNSISDFDDYFNQLENSKSFTGWTGRNIQVAPKEYENKDKFLIVLTDSGTASAAENFVKMLKQIENTIVIGTNTAGCMSFGNVQNITLPYSNLPLACGHLLSLEPDGSSAEGKGIQPDIWVSPDESLERVMKFINNYNLN